jgi:hypothetical protein
VALPLAVGPPVHHRRPDRPRERGRAPGPVPEEPGRPGADDAPGAVHRPAEDPHGVGQQRRVGRVVHVGLDHRAVDPQLPAPGHARRPSQLDDPVEQPVQRRGLDQVGPAQQRRAVRHRLQRQAAELAQHQAVGHEPLGLLVAPAVQVLDHQHAQHDLHRRRGPAGHRRPRPAPDQVVADQPEQRVVVEQAVDRRQLRLEPQRQPRHGVEQAVRIVPVA